MAIHKLQIVDFLSIDYELIAIHTSIEDYRLAYFLNKELEIKLSKNNFFSLRLVAKTTIV